MKTDRPTPETDAEWKRLQGFDGKFYAAGTNLLPLAIGMSHKCKEFEQQRDEARELLAAESRDAVAIAQKLIDATDQIQELQLALNAERAESANQMFVVEGLRRERDNALSDFRQADTDSIRAIQERNEARFERDELREMVGELKRREYSYDDLSLRYSGVKAIAGELIAAVRTNHDCGTFTVATDDEIEQWLKHWVDRLERAKEEATSRIEDYEQQIEWLWGRVNELSGNRKV